MSEIIRFIAVNFAPVSAKQLIASVLCSIAYKLSSKNPIPARNEFLQFWKLNSIGSQEKLDFRLRRQMHFSRGIQEDYHQTVLFCFLFFAFFFELRISINAQLASSSHQRVKLISVTRLRAQTAPTAKWINENPIFACVHNWFPKWAYSSPRVQSLLSFLASCGYWRVLNNIPC